MEKITDFIKKYFKELAAFAVMLVAYFPIFLWMKERWFAEDSYYSHGILIPFVSGFLIWQMKDELKQIERKSSPVGMVLIFIGAIIYLLCAILRVSFASGFSMLFVFVGFILHFWGIKILKKIAFPVAFLFFMVPLPSVVIVNLSFRLKMFAAQIATWVINHNVGIPAARFGSIIKMPTSQVVVDDVCSGLRSLVSLTALGSIFAFWMKGNMVKRILLFLCTIPIAIITNVCRVVLLASVSEIWGAQYAEGFVHDISGYMIFAIAFILLVSVKKLLE